MNIEKLASKAFHVLHAALKQEMWGKTKSFYYL